ncbi:MAG TPA: hypothetical protein VGP22_04585 [Albitalea sp.]|jgi:hypothetical protein|nr:hypothetical protein [Albitalea sp.]
MNTHALKLLQEFIELCAIGDVDEETEAHGWGALIAEAKGLLELEGPQRDLAKARRYPSAPRFSPAVSRVLAERRRQVDVEGFDAEHDDCHDAGDLALAAAAYAHHGGLEISPANDGLSHAPDTWPWDEEWWKPKGAKRDLERAAALLIAELERMGRAEVAARAAR